MSGRPDRLARGDFAQVGPLKRHHKYSAVDWQRELAVHPLLGVPSAAQLALRFGIADFRWRLREAER